MRLIRIFLLFFFSVFFMSGLLQAQQVRDYQVVENKGKQYFLHKVRMGETFFSISKRFESNRPTIMNLNPKTVNGLKVGQVIKIPYKSNLNLPELIQLRTGKPISFVDYTIKGRRETAYSIAKKYNISVDELYTYNGRVRDYVKGVRLKIPQWKKNEPQQGVVTFKKIARADDGKFIKHTVQPKETLYSLSMQYNVSIGDILLHNHAAKDLKAGTVIYIPVKSALQLDEKDVPQQKNDLDKYIYHTIKAGETEWSITHEYQITREELLRANPELKGGFPVGKIIHIPIKRDEQKQEVDSTQYYFHRVQKQETLFGIAQYYNVSQKAIITLNPELKEKMLREGETLLIPKLEVKDDKFTFKYKEKFMPERCKISGRFYDQHKTYQVALFLPLYSNQDIVNAYSDSLKNVNKFYKNSESFIFFYEGVLLALDKMRKAGLKVQLNVYDTNKSTYAVKKIINRNNFVEPDLIIGPIYPSVQKEVALWAYQNNIPIISPLATVSKELKSNNNFFQVTPTGNYLDEKTAQLILEDFSDNHIVVLKTGGETGDAVVEALHKYVREQNDAATNYVLDLVIHNFSKTDLKPLEAALSKDKPNVIYLPSTNEGEVSLAVSNLNNLKDDYDIMLIGSYKYADFKNLEIEHFHNLQLHYIAPYFVDYKDNETVELVRDFRNNFFAEPNAFAFQGYDIAYFFLNALKSYGKNFAGCIPYLDIHTTQGKYQFEKYNYTGGYMNGGVSVVKYEPNFDVVRKKVLSY